MSGVINLKRKKNVNNSSITWQDNKLRTKTTHFETPDEWKEICSVWESCVCMWKYVHICIMWWMIHIYNFEWIEGWGYFLGPANISKQQSLLLNNNIQAKRSSSLITLKVKIHVGDLPWRMQLETCYRFTRKWVCNLSL